jgi:hypothetical protein
MRGGSRKRALKLHDRSEELLRDISGPSAPIAEVVASLMQELGDYDEDAGEVITEEAKAALMLAFLRGYTLRLACEVAIEVPMPDDDPGACVVGLMELVHDDAWFFQHAFPPGDDIWFRLAVPFHSLTVAMIHEHDRDAPIWPMDVVDDLLRTGYLAAHVDACFDLKPTYRGAG